MNYKDIVDIIFEYRGDVWQHWVFLVTLNIAMWGWLIQRKGLYGRVEKVVATVGYSAFVIIIISGMKISYDNLDLACNELYAHHETEKLKISDRGIIRHLIDKSPEFCVKKNTKPNGAAKCHPYSHCFNDTLIYILLGWVFSMILFWSSRFWERVRHSKKT